MPLEPGQTLGPYRIVSQLGEGGFATVYKGYQAEFDRPVTIKVLDERLARNPRFIDRFRREAEATFSLKHPNIVEVYDFAQSGGLYFMVMEYIDGPTLRSILAKKGAHDVQEGEDEATRLREKLDLDVTLEREDEDVTLLRELAQPYQALEVGLVVQVAADVCNALAYAHEHGVIHRDLKPDNVLIATNGRVMLIDFGIARIQEDTHFTRTGMRIGTMAYMSPEQVRGVSDLDRRSDIYSLGIMLYELLTGTVPFVGNELAVMQMHTKEKPISPTALRDGIPANLEKIVLRCLEKQPDDRYDTALEVRQELLGSARPTPISSLFGTPSREAEAKKVDERGGQGAWLCSQCGYTFDSEADQQSCPACEAQLSRSVGWQEHDSLHTEGQNFLDSFKLAPGMSLDVRAYEYGRSIAPQLRERYQKAVEAWRQVLVHGSVAVPTSELQSRAEPAKVLAAARHLQRLALLWESAELDPFVVKIDDRRERAQRVGELRGRAYQLIGLYHSLRGAAGLATAEITAAYQTAQVWYARAEETLSACKSDLARAVHLSARLTSIVLNFPQTPEDPLPILDYKGVQAPGIEADRAAYESYQDSLGRGRSRIDQLKDEARRLVEKARDLIAKAQVRMQELDKEEKQIQVQHEQRVSDIHSQYRAKTERLNVTVNIIRWGIIIAAFILGFIGSSVVEAGRGFAYLAFPLAAGYLAAKSYKVRFFENYDLGVIGAIAIADYLALQDARSELTLILIIGSLGLIIFGIYAFSDYIKKGTNAGGMYLLGALVLLAALLFCMAAGSQNDEFTGPFFMVGLLFSAGLGVGSYYRRSRSGVDLIGEQEQQELRQNTEQREQQGLKARTNRREVASQAVMAVQQVSQEVLGKFSQVLIEAHWLAARFLGTQNEAELAGVQTLEADLTGIQKAIEPLKTVATPADRATRSESASPAPSGDLAPRIEPRGPINRPDIKLAPVDTRAPLITPERSTPSTAKPSETPTPARRPDVNYFSDVQPILPADKISVPSVPPAQPVERTVELRGGWVIPKQGLLGMSQDVELNAEVKVGNGAPALTEIINQTRNYFSTRAKYKVETRTPSVLFLSRGSTSGKMLSGDIKTFPTDVRIEFNPLSTGPLLITLRGKVASKGSLATNCDELHKELRGYIEQLKR